MLDRIAQLWRLHPTMPEWWIHQIATSDSARLAREAESMIRGAQQRREQAEAVAMAQAMEIEQELLANGEAVREQVGGTIRYSLPDALAVNRVCGESVALSDEEREQRTDERNQRLSTGELVRDIVADPTHIFPPGWREAPSGRNVINFANGSRIISVPGSAETIRGAHESIQVISPWVPAPLLEVDYATALDDSPTFTEALAALEAHRARRAQEAEPC